MCAVCVLSHVQLFAAPWTVSVLGSSVHGILQARMLEWVAISYSRGSSWPMDQPWVSCIGRRIPYHFATWEGVCSLMLNKWQLLLCQKITQTFNSFITSIWGKSVSRLISPNKGKNRITIREGEGGLPWWSRDCSPNVGGLGSIPGQGTRSHVPQLRPRKAK